MGEGKESFVFYKSFYDAIKRVPEECQLELYNAILSYSLEGKEVEKLSPIAEAMFILIKPNIDSSQRRYEASVNNGKKGGRPKKETQEEPNKNPEETQEEPDKNLNDNVDDNVDVNVDDNKKKNKKKKFQKPTIEEVQKYCYERKNNINAQQFLNHYESNGWMVGKNAMKDWQAAIRTWEQRNKSNTKKSVVEEWLNSG